MKEAHLGRWTVEAYSVLVQCGLAIGNVHLCVAQDACGGSGLGYVQRAVGGTLYSPSEQRARLTEALYGVRRCQQVCEFVE